MQTLIKRLKEETKELKINYLKKTESWSKEQLQRNIERKNRQSKLTFIDSTRASRRKAAEWQIVVSREEYYREEKFFWNSPSWYFTQEFISRTIKQAEEHYHNSIEKLAARIEKKGLNIDNLQLSTSYLDPNISTKITDGKKTVNAWTIIASGPIQRPHYRYLIK